MCENPNLIKRHNKQNKNTDKGSRDTKHVSVKTKMKQRVYSNTTVDSNTNPD